MKRGAMLLVVVLGVGLVLTAPAADFSGDGTGDVAIFREASGLWAVRGVTRSYFGGTGDIPVPGDYSGDRSDREAIFRPSSGLWAIRGLTRVYFGGAADEPMPGDYDGDGSSSPAIFRPSTGLWAVKGVTRVYFGSADDEAIGAGPAKDPLKVINETTAAQEAGFYAAFNLQSVQPDLDSANIRSGVTIFGVEGDPNVVDTSSGDAIALQIMAGRVAWVDGSEITGVLPTRTINSAQTSQQWGFYSAFNLQSEDEDLAAGNIKKDEVVYGVVGTYNGPGLLRTGQTFSGHTGDDGWYQDGAAFSYQTLDPAGNGDIVTVDNVTGLMWASDGIGAGCNFGAQTYWPAAVQLAEDLTFAGYSDWRLPNIRQLISIVHFGLCAPAIDGTYFPNDQNGRYWSSTVLSCNTNLAWYLNSNSGIVNQEYKNLTAYYFRPVRGGE